MAFADLSPDDQADKVSDALEGVLGPSPSKLDYVHLLRVTWEIMAELEAEIMADLGAGGAEAN